MFSFSSLWSKMVKTPAKKYLTKAATKYEDTIQNVEEPSSSLSSETNGDATDTTYENRHCSSLGINGASGTKNGGSQSIPDSTPKDVGTKLCPSPEGVPSGRFYKSTLSKSKYERQQLRHHGTAAKLKEQQKEYHSAMIRSLVSSREAKAKQVKQEKLISQGANQDTLRKDRQSGFKGAYLLSSAKKNDRKPTQSARPSGAKRNTSRARISKSGTALYSSSQPRFKDPTRSYSGIAIGVHTISDWMGRNTDFKRTFNPWRKKSLDRLKSERASSASIDMPLNLTARNSTSSRGSNSSFPSLPSYEKLQFPRSRHELLLMERNSSFLQISQFPLSPRTSKTSGATFPSSHETDPSQSQSVSVRSIYLSFISYFICCHFCVTKSISNSNKILPKLQGSRIKGHRWEQSPRTLGSEIKGGKYVMEAMLNIFVISM